MSNDLYSQTMSLPRNDDFDRSIMVAVRSSLQHSSAMPDGLLAKAAGKAPVKEVSPFSFKKASLQHFNKRGSKRSSTLSRAFSIPVMRLSCRDKRRSVQKGVIVSVELK
jgi:hypothetical protein